MQRTEFDGPAFKKALATVLPAASRSSTLPILEHIRVRLAGIDASDLVVQITAPVDARGDAINICLPADKLRAAAAVAGDKIVFEAEAGHCTIKAGKSRFKVPYLPGSDFPMIDEIEPETSLQTTAAMHAAIERVLFAAGVHDIRHYLNGVYLECGDGEIEATATNGHSLATIKVGRHNKPFATLLHRVTVEILAKAAAGTLHVSRNMIVLESDDARIVAKSIDGQYPQWQRLIAIENRNSITLPRAALIDAIGLSKLTRIKDKTRPTRLRDQGDTFTVTAEGMAGERIETEIAVTASSGPERLDVGVNGDLAEPLLKAHDDEQVTLMWQSQPHGAILAASGDLRTVIMPLRV